MIGLLYLDIAKKALNFGTSLGAKQLTAITELGEVTTKILRNHYTPIWDNSISIEPIHREDIEESNTQTEG